MGIQPGAVAIVQVTGHLAIASRNASSLLESHRETSIARFPSTASTSTRRSRSTRPVTYIVGCSAFAHKNAVSSMPNDATSPTRPGSSTSGVP